MVRISRSIGMLSAVGVCTASTILHRRSCDPDGFVYNGPALDEHVIQIRLALASSNIQGLRDDLNAITNPSSPRFRQWLSHDQVKSFTQPSDDTTSIVSSWASSNNLTASTISSHGQWVSISLPVAQANKLFDAQFSNFTHVESGHSIVRTLSFSLSDELVGHIRAAHPSTSFTLPAGRSQNAEVRWARRQFGSRGAPTSCVDEMNPTCLEELYGLPSTLATQQHNSVLVTGYGGQFVLPDAPSIFVSEYQPLLDPNTTTFTLQQISGAHLRHGGEANLDLEYVMGLALGVPATFLAVGGIDFGTELMDTISWVEGLENVPSVMTTSYSQNEDLIDPAVAHQICDHYMALGARGLSIINSAGDGGVNGHTDGPCGATTFVPTFPSSCPYVTGVGATVGINPETAANFSGGGFSNYFARPSYQDDAVQGFISQLPDDFAGTFNSSGRGFPDVAVQGVNFPIVITSDMQRLASGTSASTPAFAAVIAILNDRLLAEGKPVLGFLNPWIYEHGLEAFTDVTEGRNPGWECPSDGIAFEAAEGWDPITGFGTPLYSKLAAAAGIMAYS